MKWLDGITDSMGMNLGKPLGDGDGQGMGPQRVEHDLMTEQQRVLKLPNVVLVG